MIVGGPDFIWCCGDWRSFPIAAVDHVITDPPYTDHVQDRLLAATKTKGEVTQHTVDFAAVNSEVAFAAELVGTARRWTLICCALEQLGDYRLACVDRWVRSGIYCKVRAMPQLSGDRPANRCEGIAIFHAPGRKKWNGGGTHAFWMARPENRKVTRIPTAKPMGLCRQLIELFTDPGDTVFDPYGGVASIGVACRLLGRKYVGCEADPATWELGREDLQYPQVALERRGGWGKGYETP